MSLQCPCGFGQAYRECCGPYLTGQKKAPTPEALMRSRYSAFAKRKFAYLVKTMRGEAAKKFDISAVQRDGPLIQWLKLEILHSEMDEDTGIVAFNAYFRSQKRDSVLYEKSRFEKIEAEWFYVGQILP